VICNCFKRTDDASLPEVCFILMV